MMPEQLTNKTFDIESAKRLLNRLELENPALPMRVMLKSRPVFGYSDFVKVLVGSLPTIKAWL